MLVSFNWLKNYVNLPDSVAPEEVALKLTMSTVEVDGLKKTGEFLDGVVVGEILEIKKHPDADKLSIAKVDIGEGKPRQIIFGQMVEMKVGLKVPMALAPTVLPGNKEIKKAKLRGEVSEGMLCLDQELGLSKEGVSIQFFGKEVKNGTQIVKVLGLDDTIFNIDNKSMTHRPDLWGHYGLAREIAALYNKKLKNLDLEDQKIKRSKDQTADLKIEIQDKENCTRYIGAVVGGIKIESSPAWMQNYLSACGVRPINNIVDITNYVTLELGRPSHAFDRRNIAEDTIIVRRAKPGEKITTLDGVVREMTDQMCLVCDAKRAVDLGGIMGGENSEVKNDTTEIILELANFNPANIRRTSVALGLRTEAGMRFEKGLSPYLAEVGMKRILTLIKQLIPGAYLLSKIVDVDYTPKENRKIELDLDFLKRKIGQEIFKKEVIKILGSLGFTVKEKKEQLLVVVPKWRSVKDISISEDLVEEVARVYGYDNIKTQLPVCPVAPPERNELRMLERKVKEILALEFGFSEVYNYSFFSLELMKKIGLPLKDHIELSNPIAKDRPYLRHNLWPNLLDNVENNLHRFDRVKLFEVGKVFVKDKPGFRAMQNSDELLPRQDLMLSMAYAEKSVVVPFYELSEALSGLMKRLGYQYELESAANNENEDLIAHHGRGATINVSGEMIGAIAELHPVTQHNLGIETRVASLEINLDKLLECKKEFLTFCSLPEYPEVIRDIAFVVDKKVEHSAVVKVLKEVDPLIVEIKLFDVYEGKNLAENKKGVAYHLTYQSPNRTLTSEEVDKVQEKMIKAIEKEFAAEIRR